MTIRDLIVEGSDGGRRPEGVSLDEPCGVLGFAVREQRDAQLLDGVGAAHTGKVPLQGADEALGAAAALGGAGGQGRNPRMSKAARRQPVRPRSGYAARPLWCCAWCGAVHRALTQESAMLQVPPTRPTTPAFDGAAGTESQ